MTDLDGLIALAKSHLGCSTEDRDEAQALYNDLVAIRQEMDRLKQVEKKAGK